MAARSTRQKIRDQAQRMVHSAQDVLNHLKGLVDLADGRSDYINSNAGYIVELQDHFEKVLVRFRDGL